MKRKTKLTILKIFLILMIYVIYCVPFLIFFPPEKFDNQLLFVILAAIPPYLFSIIFDRWFNEKTNLE